MILANHLDTNYREITLLLQKIKNILQFSLNLILLGTLWLQDIFATLTMHCTMLIQVHGACQPCTLKMIS